MFSTCYISLYSGLICSCFFFFFKQKTAYEMRISDWSSDVCSSDLILDDGRSAPMDMARLQQRFEQCPVRVGGREHHLAHLVIEPPPGDSAPRPRRHLPLDGEAAGRQHGERDPRSEEHTSELQSLMRISYAVFCLTKKKNQHQTPQSNNK